MSHDSKEGKNSDLGSKLSVTMSLRQKMINRQETRKLSQKSKLVETIKKHVNKQPDTQSKGSNESIKNPAFKKTELVSFVNRNESSMEHNNKVGGTDDELVGVEVELMQQDEDELDRLINDMIDSVKSSSESEQLSID